MDWIITIQKAIEYIEEHLIDEGIKLRLESIAEYVHSSESHFLKIFSIVTGVTVGEYIRNRRLTLAGEEVLLTDTKIIDIALKYGYETPESFSKAFSRFHGAAPKEVRKNSSALKSYHRLNINFKLEGGQSLDYRVQQQCSIRVLAKLGVFKAKTVDQDRMAMADFLKHCAKEGLYETLAKANEKSQNFKNVTFGIHDGVGCAEDDSEFRFGIGVEYNGEDVSDGYDIIEIASRRWITFQCIGVRPTAIQNLWYKVYTEFLPFTSYKVDEDGILEVCREGFRNGDDVVSELWLPLLND